MKHTTKIVQDTEAYIESIGRQDKEVVREALKDGGKDAVLRVCIGATDKVMPLRALSLAACVMVVQDRYFPNAQLQFVHPLYAAEAANAIPVGVSKHEAVKFDYDRLNIGSPNDSYHDKTGLIDTPGLIGDDLVSAVSDVLTSHPNVASPLSAASNGRAGSAATYVAAHLVMHDTNPRLVPIDTDAANPQAKSTERVISIGAQSERMFYLARMTCRQAGVMPEEANIETGQLFTRHILPPYLHCREGGEPTLDDYYQRTQPAHAVDTSHQVLSVSRDLQYLREYLYGISPNGYLPAEVTLS